MARITPKGIALAHKLSPYLGTTNGIDATCSLIARHATTYAWMQETWCSVELNERQTADLEKREARIEQRIADLVDDLPWTDGGQIRVQFDGDPRGPVVRLLVPDDNVHRREIPVA